MCCTLRSVNYADSTCIQLCRIVNVGRPVVGIFSGCRALPAFGHADADDLS